MVCGCEGNKIMAKITLRIWILIIVLMLALLMISPSFKEGVLIKSVDANSTAFNNGLMQGARITAINGQLIKNIQDYTKAVSIYDGNTSKKIEITASNGDFVFLTDNARSEEHTSELQSHVNLVCRLPL